MTSIGTTSKKVILNYNFQKVDTRDYKFLVNSDQLSLLGIPSNFSLKDKITKIYDQGNLGSCVSNAFAGCRQATFHRLWNGRIARDDCQQSGIPCLPFSGSSPRGLDSNREYKSLHDFG